MQGSIEHAGNQLEAYQALLQKEVIASFDKAVQHKDLSTMAECALVMSQFERGDAALMQVSAHLQAVHHVLCASAM